MILEGVLGLTGGQGQHPDLLVLDLQIDDEHDHLQHLVPGCQEQLAVHWDYTAQGLSQCASENKIL